MPVTRLDSGDTEVKKTAEVIALKEYSESARIYKSKNVRFLEKSNMRELKS